MFIGHYKCVLNPKEFYSQKKKNLNFPIQVELDGERYLLNNTIQITSSKQEIGLLQMADKNSIRHSVKLD